VNLRTLAHLDLRSLHFHERRWSFVLNATEPLFIKVPKASVRATLVDALKGSEERRLARNEFETRHALTAHDTEHAAVVRPVALLDDAPVVLTQFSHLRGSTEWAPHPVTRAQLMLELNSALLALRRVAGVLSNEVVITARRTKVSHQ
jgi:hypothetical protein